MIEDESSHHFKFGRGEFSTKFGVTVAPGELASVYCKTCAMDSPWWGRGKRNFAWGREGRADSPRPNAGDGSHILINPGVDS